MAYKVALSVCTGFAGVESGRRFLHVSHAILLHVVLVFVLVLVLDSVHCRETICAFPLIDVTFALALVIHFDDGPVLDSGPHIWR